MLVVRPVAIGGKSADGVGRPSAIGTPVLEPEALCAIAVDMQEKPAPAKVFSRASVLDLYLQPLAAG